MTSDFSRRGFLKGLSAVAGLIVAPIELKAKDNTPLLWTPDQPTPIIAPPPYNKLTVTVSQGDKVLLKYDIDAHGHLAWISSPNDPVIEVVTGRDKRERSYLRELSLHTTMHHIDSTHHRTFVSSTGHVIENTL